MPLVNPHGPKRELMPRLVEGEEAAAVKERAAGLLQVPLSSREASDVIMLGTGSFTPLLGFMGQADGRRVCDEMMLADGTFWPIPITCSASSELAAQIAEGQEVALFDTENGEVMGVMTVEEKYSIDKAHECQSVFGTTDPEHPGVAKVMGQGEVNLAGPVTVFSEGPYPARYRDIYYRPADARRLFESKGWNTVAAFQTRNPMHRSHEFLAKIAVETCDGLFVHQILGKLKEGDIPAEVRVRAIDALVNEYFVPDTCVQGGYPMEMRYAGPREALLHGVIRQNFGCSHLVVGRDHAGVGSYYGPYDAQRIFDTLPAGSLELRPLKVSATFHCFRCNGMASERTCPHPGDQRLNISGTKLRQMFAAGEEVPAEFSRPEVLAILREYYAGLAKS